MNSQTNASRNIFLIALLFDIFVKKFYIFIGYLDFFFAFFFIKLLIDVPLSAYFKPPPEGHLNTSKSANKFRTAPQRGAS
jgi:hypothetical protein